MVTQIAFEQDQDDYDKRSLQIGMLVKRHPNNQPLKPFSYSFMNSCCRSYFVPYPYMSEKDNSSVSDNLIAVSFSISDGEFGKSWANFLKPKISYPSLYLVSTFAQLKNYNYGHDPHFPKRWAEDKDNPHRLWDDWVFDETSRNFPKFFLFPLYVGRASNAYERWFVGKHHRLPEINLLSKIGLVVHLTIYLPPQDDYALSERILINDLKPIMNNNIFLKETERVTLDDPWFD